MPQDLGYYTAFRATATGTVSISTVNAALRGVLFHGTGTGFVHLFAGVTSTVTSGTTYLGRVIAYATVTGATANAAVYVPFPAYCNNGLTAVIGASADPALTIFWDPAGDV